jgi:hypothetical protein
VFDVKDVSGPDNKYGVAKGILNDPKNKLFGGSVIFAFMYCNL